MVGAAAREMSGSSCWGVSSVGGEVVGNNKRPKNCNKLCKEHNPGSGLIACRLIVCHTQNAQKKVWSSVHIAVHVV